MRFKAVIFDLDGTLVNSLEDIADSCNEALHRCGYPVHSIEQYPLFVGQGIRNLVRFAMPLDLQADEQKIDACFDLFFDIYRNNCCRKTVTYPGIADVVARLHEKGVKMAVLSNKADGLTQIVVNTLFEKGVFGLVLGPSATLPRKPDPAGVLRICETFGVELSETLLVGDSKYDILTARNAGVKCVAVSWGFQPRKAIEEHCPDMVVDSTDELLRYILS